MEEKNDIGIKHLLHPHLLILNENYVARKGAYLFCRVCYQKIDSSKSFVYSCSNITSTTSTSTGGVKKLCVKFLLHKTCAELPPKIVNPIDLNEFLFFRMSYTSRSCIICGLERRRCFMYGSSVNTNIYVCIKCAVFQVEQFKEDPVIFDHPGHSYHPLALIERPSSFKCNACKVTDSILDSSYRCTKCQFWIHKSCGDAPHSFQFQFHKHPLILSFFLPQVYRKFPQFCKICHEKLKWIEWLYCCGSCRYFTHFGCARSSPMLSSDDENETCPNNLVHLPAADELSLNLLLEQFIKDNITLSNSYNNSSISGAPNYIKHWSHEEHDLKLITISELYDGKNDDDEISLLCEGCVMPIPTHDGLSYYGCVPCKYFMHKFCAELPGEIEHHLWPGKTLFTSKYSQPFMLFRCRGCQTYCNGIFYAESMTPSDEEDTSDEEDSIRLHIGCVSLPKVIKHEAHHHQLDLVFRDDTCNACQLDGERCKYRCEKCEFNICGKCVRYVRTYKHRWDPHPLELKYDAGMVEEHEHEFDCEYCSREIDTNGWFYHCSSTCDLSFHLRCIEKSSFSEYKYVKFGATDIIIDELHPHRLTFVLNKKVRSCEKCGGESLGEPVLQCATCYVIFCHWCYYPLA